MCKHADNTKQIIDHILGEVYPQLTAKIIYAVNCLRSEQSEAPDKYVVMNIIADLRNEFNSLVTYEQKLVFPSVLKVFLTVKENEPIPNLVELLKLTKSKEYKLMHHVKKIDALIEHSLWNSAAQQVLTKAFSHEFIVEKKAWYKMIDERLNTCNCFKKNYFEMAKFYDQNIHPIKSGNTTK